MKNHKLGVSIMFAVVLLVALFPWGKDNLSNQGEGVITKDNNEITLKIENTKSIDIYNVISSDSSSGVNFTDSETINQLENLFNKTTFIKSTESVETTSRYVKFRKDNNDLSFFIYANDIVDIDGTKYKSNDAIFDEINRLYIKYK